MKSNFFKARGKTTKKVKEGGINKSIELVRSTTDLISFVSKYNQVIAKAEVSGIEANIPAIKLDLLAISEMATMIITVIIVLMTRYITYRFLLILTSQVSL